MHASYIIAGCRTPIGKFQGAGKRVGAEIGCHRDLRSSTTG